MNDQNLVIDVGNTRLKWGLSKDGVLSRTGSVSREKLDDQGYSTLTRRLPRRIDRVLISNVGGQVIGKKLIGVIGAHGGVSVHFARSEKAAFGLTNAYRQPRRLGVDRWAAMVGARHHFGGAICVIDMGSAVSIDAVNNAGQHLGGQIIPGLHMMHRMLVENTDGIRQQKLSRFEPQQGMDYFADGTGKAIQAGALNAVCGAIERSVASMRKARLRPKIIVTGGGAGPVVRELGDKVIHRPHLVLLGLVAMLEAQGA